MPDILSKLQSKLQAGDELERCGLVLKSGRIIELENRHPRPANGFAISVSEMDRRYDKLAGTWHTHPHGNACLSQEDYLGFSGWPGLTHYIVGRDEIRAYRADDDGVVQEVDLASD